MGGDDKVILWKDEEGLCVHIMHRANTAQVLGTESVSALRIANLAVTDLKPFQRMIDCDFFRFSPWRPPVRYPAASIDLPAAGGASVSTAGGSLALAGPSVSIPVSFDEDDIRPRLRGSTLSGSAEILGKAAEASVLIRPRADT